MISVYLLLDLLKISVCYLGSREFFSASFRFSSAQSQRPASAGRVTRGRRSCDPRAQVA